MYALVEIAGKQYKAEAGAQIKVDKLAGAAGDSVTFDSVLMLSDGEKVTVGAPYVQGAAVTATIEHFGRDPKITVFKYKRRKRYKRTRGHRQHFAVVSVNEVKAGA